MKVFSKNPYFWLKTTIFMLRKISNFFILFFRKKYTIYQKKSKFEDKKKSTKIYRVILFLSGDVVFKNFFFDFCKVVHLCMIN